MLFLIAISVAVSAGLTIYLAAAAFPARSRAVRARISEMGLDELLGSEAAQVRRRKRRKLQDLLLYLGEQFQTGEQDWGKERRRLIHAGYTGTAALPLFLGIRVGAMAVLFLYGVLFGAAIELSSGWSLMLGVAGAAAGWVVPGFIVSRRISRRQKEIQKALPDALDLLVICVEAGLGLNQALVRVASEMRHVSTLMTEHIVQMNMAIRAGTPRDQALITMADRTGVSDVRSLATMLIQTERFGTSIAGALRIHSETIRTKRRQRTEEAAAKTTIKMVFPLAFCIFPSLFVVVLGPAILEIMTSLRSLRG